MFTYQVSFTGFGTNRVVYRDQQISIRCGHNWDLSDEEGANVLFLARKEIKKHFSRFSIVKIEKEG
jgi:hypothetical protein